MRTVVVLLIGFMGWVGYTVFFLQVKTPNGPSMDLQELYRQLQKDPILELPDLNYFRNRFGTEQGLSDLYNQLGASPNLELPDFETFKAKFYEPTMNYGSEDYKTNPYSEVIDRYIPNQEERVRFKNLLNTDDLRQKRDFIDKLNKYIDGAVPKDDIFLVPDWLESLVRGVFYLESTSLDDLRESVKNFNSKKNSFYEGREQDKLKIESAYKN